MYHVPYFKEPDQDVLISFMQAHPFVVLTGVNALQQPVATHVPVFTDEREGRLFLTGHIMRKTDHHRAFEHNPRVLAIFNGPHAYVSASWYADTRQASTWNYMTVHAGGNIRFLSEDELYALLKRTTHHFENDQPAPSLMEQLPQTYVSEHMKAIVAFEIEVEKLEHVFKLSQNRDEQSYDSIVRHLEQKEGQAAELAAIMKNRKQKVFHT
jgi:transcriptional regulator